MTSIASRRDFMQGVFAAGALAASSSMHAAETTAPDYGTLVVNGLDPSELRAEYLDLLRAGGVHCWHRGGGGMTAFAELLAFCAEHKDRIAPAYSVRDIRTLHAQGKIAHVSGWQSAGRLADEGSNDKPAFANLRAYQRLGLRICGIAYNLTNAFGGGCLAPDPGLTPAGRNLVENLHELRILLDVGGHTGERTSFDALAMSSGVPVICSHTNLRALNDNPRCSTDALLEAIARTGGVIGISAFSDFHMRTRKDADVLLSPQASLDRHLDQYDYLRKLVGVEHIGIGPDFIEGRNSASTLTAANKLYMAAEAYSQQMPWYYVKGFENIAQLPNVVQGLRARGWKPAELRKVLGENWLRVYEQVWGV